MTESYGSSDRYFQEHQGREKQKLVPEGIEGLVPFKGSMVHIVYQLMGGLRASMGYVGAETITAMQAKARFIQATVSGQTEGHVHDVMMTKEPPNYHRD